MDIQDKQLQKIIGLTLRGGVLTAVAVALIGGTMYLYGHSTEPVSFHIFAGENTPYASPLQIFHQAFLSPGLGVGRRGLAIIQIGIICLLLTPIIRVALSIIGFAMERDRVYVVITSVVLATLICSMLLH